MILDEEVTTLLSLVLPLRERGNCGALASSEFFLFLADPIPEFFIQGVHLDKCRMGLRTLSVRPVLLYPFLNLSLDTASMSPLRDFFQHAELCSQIFLRYVTYYFVDGLLLVLCQLYCFARCTSKMIPHLFHI